MALNIINYKVFFVLRRAFKTNLFYKRATNQETNTISK